MRPPPGGTAIRPTLRWTAVGAVLGVGVLVLIVAVTGWPLHGFDRVEVDPGAARDRLDAANGAVDRAAHDDLGSTTEVELEGFSFEEETLATLVLGSDVRDEDDGSRADAIMLVVAPPDGEPPVIASIPRDLWVDNPCTGTKSRINEGLEGCGDDISGPELMMVMVEDLAGIAIDHYAEVDFEGFVRIVDAFGGVEVCTDHPVRDDRADLDLPGGCVQAGGDDALAWARSRYTQELVDGTWRFQPGINALVRDERQQELVLDIVGRIARFESVGELRGVASGLQDAVTLDDDLSLTRGVALAWRYRELDTDEVQRVTLPVVDHVTSGGAEVVVPQGSLREDLAEALGRAPSEPS